MPIIRMMTNVGYSAITRLRLPFLQPFWEKVNRASLCAMNIGPAGDIAVSGERGVIRKIARILCDQASSPVVFDVGANVGVYSQAVRDAFGDRALLYSFEPSPANFQILEQRLGRLENVSLLNLGFSDREETRDLYWVDSDESGLCSLYNRRLAHLGVHTKSAEAVRLTTIDRFAEERAIGFIHLLKMDVEGHEYKVLAGASHMLESRAIAIIQFEFGNCNIASRTYFQDFYYLLEPNYRIYRILGQGLRPVRGYRESQEVFLTTNYLAVAKDLDARYSL
jgi:FkbM family methyltransferase